MHAEHVVSAVVQPGQKASFYLSFARRAAATVIVATLAATAHAGPPEANPSDPDQRLLLQQIAELLQKYLANSQALTRRPAQLDNRPTDQPGSAYIQGLRDGYAAGLLDSMDNTRKQKLLRNRERALRAGLMAFRSGRYDRAADMFMLACELDHGDPASRLHAAQALFALGQYQEAVRLIRRAFELQPKLIYLRFDLRKDYGKLQDFAEQLNRFRQVLANRPKWAAGYLLLGYQLLYTGQRARAHAAFKKAGALQPSDQLIQKMLKVSIPLPNKRFGEKSGPTTRPVRRSVPKA